MTRIVHATFDGQVLRPDEPVELEPNTRVRITIEAITGPGLVIDFWQPPTREQLVETQQVGPIVDLAGLAVEFWPEQESADDFIEFVYQQRREDTLEP